MHDDAFAALQIMADKVTRKQNCVLELLIGDNGMLAHLIPLEAWESALMEDDEDEEDE